MSLAVLLRDSGLAGPAAGPGAAAAAAACCPRTAACSALKCCAAAYSSLILHASLMRWLQGVTGGVVF
jgi:hypothetical protein